ncbi:translational GTPase TypA, partial [Klebsiella pneumoniae]|nr:translational GTPase TypA [Klebsiella pneumoniae]
GKIHRGKVKKNQTVSLVRNDGSTQNYKITAVFTYDGLKRVEVEEAGMGDIVAVSGVLDANIGETIADSSAPEALPFVHIDEPTLSMNFMVNDSPFSGQEGDFVTSRHLRD